MMRKFRNICITENQGKKYFRYNKDSDSPFVELQGVPRVISRLWLMISYWNVRIRYGVEKEYT